MKSELDLTLSHQNIPAELPETKFEQDRVNHNLNPLKNSNPYS